MNVTATINGWTIYHEMGIAYAASDDALMMIDNMGFWSCSSLCNPPRAVTDALQDLRAELDRAGERAA